MNRLRVPQPLQVLLAMLFVPPFAILSGILLGVLLWFLLADAGLPTWARIAISFLAIPALPGLWFAVLPLLFWSHRAKSVELPADVQAWQTAQFEAVERHQDAFDALRRQRIERVIPGGTSVTVDGIETTVIAIELGAHGGVITLAQRPLVAAPPNPPDPSTFPEAIPFLGPIARLTDGIGTDYVVFVEVSEFFDEGGRTRIDFVPPPPPNAGELRLSLSHLYVRGVVLNGPWDFTLPLGQ